MSVSPYQIGHCTQCGIKIMTKNSKGKFCSFRPIFRRITCKFSNGHIINVPICKTCLLNVNLTDILSSIVHDNSNAMNDSSKNKLKLLGSIQSFTEKDLLIKMIKKEKKDIFKYGN
jgi:hypothetical protein